METSIVAVEENPPRNSLGSVIQISSIHIDIQIPKGTNSDETNDEETNDDETNNETNHQIECGRHTFTIRGYASEMRKKNPQASMPFPSDGNLHGHGEQLPPMRVKRFRWWRCSECRELIDSTSATEENGVLPYCRPHGLLSGSTSLGTASHDDTAMVVPETQQGPTPEQSEGIRDVGMNHSPNVDVVQDSLALTIYQGANVAKTGDLAGLDGQSKLNDPVGHEPGDIREEEAVAQVGHILDTGNKGRCEHEILEVVENPGDGNSAQACGPERSNSPGRIGVAPLKACQSTSSRSDYSQQHDNPSGSSRRKARKVRLLTDLLGDVGKAQKEGLTGRAVVARKMCLGKGDSEKTVTVAEINSSSSMSLQIGSKTERKRKAEKAPEPGKRKNKQPQIRSESHIQPLEEFSGKSNLKDGDFCLKSIEAATNSVSQNQKEKGKSIADILPTASHISKSSPSSHDRSSNLGLDLSLSSLPNSTNVSAEKINSTVNLLNKNTFHSEQFSVLRPSEPDQSWRKRQVWDLNARLAPSSSSVLEKVQFPLPKEVDFLQLHTKENSFEVQGSSSGMSKETDKRAGKGLYQGSSDDIPMEIVELMAKNQFERGLGGAVKRFPEVQGSGTAKQLTKHLPGVSRFSPLNAAKGNSVNFFHIDRNRLEMENPLKMGKVHENQRNLFNAFPSDELILSGMKHFSVTAAVRAGNSPFGLGISQKSACPKSESEHKGKTISDIKADELKKAQEDHRLWPKLGSYELNLGQKGQLDPYSNDSIPAMQLLSLMDGRSPGNSFNVGRSKVLDRPFAPCGYHPRFRTDGRQDLLDGSMFLRQSRAKELSGLGTGLYTAKESSGLYAAKESLGLHTAKESSGLYAAKESLGLYTAKESSVQPSISYSRQQSFRVPPGKETEVIQISRLTDGGQSSNLGRSTGDPPPHYVDSRRKRNLEAPIIPEIVRPLRIVAPNEVCSFNRNPAEFSVPEAGNIFTICGTELKFQKRKYSRAKLYSGEEEVTATKRQRITKTKAGKEHPENHLA